VPSGYTGQCHNDDFVDWSLVTKKPAYFGNRNSRCPDIIHDQDISVGQLCALMQFEGFSDVLQPFLHVQAWLGASGFHTAKARENGDFQPAGQGST
jgi:hypothetical protein